MIKKLLVIASLIFIVSCQKELSQVKEEVPLINCGTIALKYKRTETNSNSVVISTKYYFKINDGTVFKVSSKGYSKYEVKDSFCSDNEYIK